MKYTILSRPTRVGCYLSAVVCLCGSALALAGALIHFDIPAEPAKQGLKQFARQAHLQLLFDPRELKGLRTQGVSGDWGLEEGLAQLLGNTGIDAELDPSHSQLLVRRRAIPTPEPARVTPPATRAETEPAAASDISTVTPPTVTISTGSYISGVDPIGSEVITIPREAILASGAANLGDVIKRLPQISRGGPSQATRGSNSESQSNSGLGEGVDARGLGARSTLILLDGMRLAPSGDIAGFTDVMGIPVTAIDHIEILLDGAAAIYGADAVGGVVNFITLPPGAAPETFFQGGGVTQGSLRQALIGQVIGAHWSSGKGLLVGQVDRQTPLNSLDRPYLSSDQRPYGGLDQDSNSANPATLETGGKTYAIPRGSLGIAQQPLRPDASNLTDLAQSAQVIPGQTAQSLLGKIEEHLGERWTLTSEVLVTQRRASEEVGGALASLAVPSDNPFLTDPSGGTSPVIAHYNFVRDLGPRTTKVDVLVKAATIKIERAIGERSSISLFASHVSERENQHIRGEINDSAVAAALSLTDPTRALNVFGDGSHTNSETLAGLERIPWYSSISAYDTGGAKFESELWSSRTIPVKLALGIEARGQRFDTAASDGLAPATGTRFRRSTEAGFGELDIPLISERNALPAAHRLDVSAAVRVEHTDSVHSTTPSAGLRWMPTQVIRVSAKYTESFRMPNAGDLDTSQNGALIVPLPDKSAPGGMTTVVLASGGNPSLRQEQAVSEVVGLGISQDWSSERSSRLEITYFHDKLNHRIQAPVFTGDVLNDPSQQYFVLRDPSAALRDEICASPQLSGGDRATCEGVATIVDTRLHNIQSLDVSGLDLDARLAWNPDWGHLLWTVRAVYFLDYDATDAPGLPKESLLNEAGSVVDLNLQSTLALTRDGWSCAVTFNYVSHYTNTYIDPPVPVASWSTFDFQLGHTFGKASKAESGDFEVGVVALNAFNRSPPVVLDPIQVVAYDPSNATVWGRVITLYLRKRW